MIPVEEAKGLIIQSTCKLDPVTSKVSDSLNLVLANDVISPIDYPPFSQSAMDGYAFSFIDLMDTSDLEIIGESAAGNPFNGSIGSGNAIQIFTGSKVPDGYDTVVMQEKISITDGRLKIQDANLSRGANVRVRGSHIKRGDVALEHGLVLNPGAIGFLSSLGIDTTSVYPKPRVSVVVTGNELQPSGTSLLEGNVFESNSVTLLTALETLRIAPSRIITIGDDEKQTSDTLIELISISDILIITGGISVGKYDFVGKSLKGIGVETIFYKIYQKPGKPIFFGKQGHCLVFGLPGNPASVLTCFYEYVLPAIKTMQGFKDVFLKKKMIPVKNEFNKKEGLALFLKGKIGNGNVEVLPGQESNNLSSFAIADCLVFIPADKSRVLEGEAVEVHLLP